jgi:membrane protease YdiL (CAAX protease family)
MLVQIGSTFLAGVTLATVLTVRSPTTISIFDWEILSIPNRQLADLDLHLPTLSQLRIGGGRLIIAFGGITCVAVIGEMFGVRPSGHTLDSVVSSGSADPVFFLVLLVLSVVVIAPGEELIWRNIIQRTMYPLIGKPLSIVVASVSFAAIHIPAYIGGNPSSVVSSLVVVFILSVVFGSVYAYTENLTIPIATHAVYNMIIYFSLFAQYT